MNKKGTGRAGASKRTYILPDALISRLERAAISERRPFGRQLEIFLERALDQYERELKAEPKPGQYEAALLAA